MKIVEPQQVLTSSEIARVKRAIQRYEKPRGYALAIAVPTLVGLMGLHMWLGENVSWYNHDVEGLAFFVVLASPFGIGILASHWAKHAALRTFRQVDSVYFNRTGWTEEQLIEALLSEHRQTAAILFTEQPMGYGNTAWEFPEHARAQAMETFTQEFLHRRRAERQRARFKAYVAELLGYKIPIK